MPKAPPPKTSTGTTSIFAKRCRSRAALRLQCSSALYHALATQIPDMRNRGVKKASYVVLTGTSMPAILAEVSFVSSPADEAKLKNSTLPSENCRGTVQRHRAIRCHLTRRECRQRRQQAFRTVIKRVAPASCRLSEGILPSGEGETPSRQPPGRRRYFRRAIGVGSAFFKASFSPWLLLSGPPSITRQPSS